VDLVNPYVLYAGLVVGAVGLAMVLPRPGTSPRLLGGIIAVAGLGLLLLALGVARTEAAPRVMFYVFSAIGLGAAVRVISHPRPVYAALYFILTILATSGLFLILSAEFMAFALIIVYAGAILITYLFVIMLATESPTAEEAEALAEYDRHSREPVMAVVLGLLLVATLTTAVLHGSARLGLPRAAGEPVVGGRLAQMPRKVESELRERGLLGADQTLAVNRDGGLVPAAGGGGVEVVTRGASPEAPRAAVALPADLTLTNTEGVAFAFLAEHPGSVEIAGVVLLMAMVGAVVLARKKVELEEAGAGGPGARGEA